MNIFETAIHRYSITPTPATATAGTTSGVGIQPWIDSGTTESTCRHLLLELLPVQLPSTSWLSSNIQHSQQEYQWRFGLWQVRVSSLSLSLSFSLSLSTHIFIYIYILTHTHTHTHTHRTLPTASVVTFMLL